MNAQEIARRKAIEKLQEVVKVGDTVYTILRHVSRSGTSRVIDALVFGDGEPYGLAFLVATALGESFDRDRWGVKMRGCGMDMGFETVYRLAGALYPDGFGCIGENCPSNDHTNGDRDFRPNRWREGVVSDKDGTQRLVNTHWHRDGGYALRHRWI